MHPMITIVVTLALVGQACQPARAQGLAFPAHRLPASMTPDVPATPAVDPAMADLPDAAGQHWQHADRAYLEAWIAGRNSALAPAQGTKPVDAGQPRKISEIRGTAKTTRELPMAKPPAPKAGPPKPQTLKAPDDEIDLAKGLRDYLEAEEAAERRPARRYSDAG